MRAEFGLDDSPEYSGDSIDVLDALSDGVDLREETIGLSLGVGEPLDGLAPLVRPPEGVARHPKGRTDVPLVGPVQGFPVSS